jgi:hypothetical protein
MISRVIAAWRTFINARGATPPLARARRRGFAALHSVASREPQALFLEGLRT